MVILNNQLLNHNLNVLVHETFCSIDYNAMYVCHLYGFRVESLGSIGINYYQAWS